MGRLVFGGVADTVCICGIFRLNHLILNLENMFVTICSAIWVFALAAPVRSFLTQANKRIKSASYILVHRTNGMYKNAATEVDSFLGISHWHWQISVAATVNSKYLIKYVTCKPKKRRKCKFNWVDRSRQSVVLYSILMLDAIRKEERELHKRNKY